MVTATRSSWNGLIRVGGLLVFPCKLYRATSADEYTFRQVHIEDGGRIRFERKCSVCNHEIPFEEIGKGKEIGDQMIVLTGDDLESLPSFPKEVVIDQFIRTGEVDLAAFGKAYHIAPDKAGARIYTLLRQEMKARQVAGVATFAMKEEGRDSLAILYPHGKFLILQQIAWPESIREPDFPSLRGDIPTTAAERELAGVLIETMTRPWKPGEHHSGFAEAVEKLIEAKLAGAPPPEPPTPAQAEAQADIGEVLRRAIDAAKQKQEAAV